MDPTVLKHAGWIVEADKSQKEKTAKRVRGRKDEPEPVSEIPTAYYCACLQVRLRPLQLKFVCVSIYVPTRVQ